MDGTQVVGVESGITRQIFDQTITALRDAIGDLQRVVNALDERVQATQAFQQSMMHQLDEERKAREGAISRIEHDVELLDGKLDKRLAEMDGKLDALTNSIERVHGTLSNFSTVLAVRDQATGENLERIKALEARGIVQDRSIALVTTTQAQISTELKALAGTIYGRADQPDAESLMAQLAGIRQDVKTGFAGQSAQNHQMQAEFNGLAQRMSRIEDWQATQARKWADRRAKITGYFAKLISDPKFWYALAGGTGIAALLPEETKSIIVEIIKSLLGI